ncbi:MAG: aminotransferase class III-fold pyridoxal phosphate-dependent enzyme [Firmicutes bacterium]|nr:aminotransferase class III-fold pyridoxal phosphate-dependent enzyme [Bacillota bacterium]
MNTINTRPFLEDKLIYNYPIYHPYSFLGQNYSNFLNLAKGDGVYLYDVNGKRYLDASSGLWNISLGYRNQGIEAAIVEQMNLLPYCSIFDNTNPTLVKTANKILRMLPQNFNKVFFTCSGSESIEVAIKAIRYFWYTQKKYRKNTIISFRQAYHGTYYGSMTVSGIEYEYDNMNAYAPLLGGITIFDGAGCLECTRQHQNCNAECLQPLEAYLQAHSAEVGGMMVEPVFASKGMITPPPKFLERIQELCVTFELLLAIDEVATGFYRTGTAFCFEKYQLKPELVCMSKGINSGYLPFGAVAFNRKISEILDRNRDIFMHGSTQNGNLLACAACCAAIDQYLDSKVATNVNWLSEYIIYEIKRRLEGHRNFNGIRGQGFLFSIDLVNNHKEKMKLKLEHILEIQEKLRDAGLITYRSEYGISLIPMLIMTKAEVDSMLEIITAIFERVIIS